MPIHFAWLVAMAGIVVVVVFLFAFFVVGIGRAVNGPRPPMSETPLQIPDRRFASGEINADEYQKARGLLQERAAG